MELFLQINDPESLRCTTVQDRHSQEQIVRLGSVFPSVTNNLPLNGNVFASVTIQNSPPQTQQFQVANFGLTPITFSTPLQY